MDELTILSTATGSLSLDARRKKEKNQKKKQIAKSDPNWKFSTYCLQLL